MFIFMSYIKLGKLFANIQIISLPLSLFRSLLMCVLVHLMMSPRSSRLCLLFFNLFFSFCSSIISIVLSSSSLILLSVYSNLPLNSSSEFFISVIVFFSSRISGFFWVFLSLSSYLYFVHSPFS